MKTCTKRYLFIGMLFLLGIILGCQELRQPERPNLIIDPVGRFLKQNSTNEYIHLRLDNTFETLQSGKIIAGKYTFNSNTVYFYAESGKQSCGAIGPIKENGTCIGDAILDDKGGVWIRRRGQPYNLSQ